MSAPVAPAVPSPHRANRAPALYVVGFAPGRGDAETAFRLPCPPRHHDGPIGAAAAEIRLRKAYYWTLDALRTGQFEPERAAKLARLAREVRSPVTREALTHLRRALRFVRWSSGGWPVIPAPAVPLDRILLTAPAPEGGHVWDVEMTHHYKWTLDWMRMHRWTVGRGLSIEWRRLELPTSDAPASLAIDVAVEPEVRTAPVFVELEWRRVRT